MRNYTPDKYAKITEEDPDPILAGHMQAELHTIESISDKKSKTFIDLGAGHGRIVPFLSKWGRNVIAIEINPAMLESLKEKTKSLENALVLQGDMTELEEVLQGHDLQNPVLLLMQNTLGTIEGSEQSVLEGMKKVAEEHGGEIILSLFRASALKTWGVQLYSHVSEMTGVMDKDKTDFEKGIFVSETGYMSKWRTDEEIEDIKAFLGGEVINEIWTDNYYILHMQFK